MSNTTTKKELSECSASFRSIKSCPQSCLLLRVFEEASVLFSYSQDPPTLTTITCYITNGFTEGSGITPDT